MKKYDNLQTWKIIFHLSVQKWALNCTQAADIVKIFFVRFDTKKFHIKYFTEKNPQIKLHNLQNLILSMKKCPQNTS